MDRFKVNFTVTKIEDIRSSDSSIKINAIYEGIYDPLNNSVHFTDSNLDDWSFWVGDTCELVPNSTIPKSILDIDKKVINIEDIDKAIIESISFKNYEHENKEFFIMDEKLNKYWNDIYYKLIKAKYIKK